MKFCKTKKCAKYLWTTSSTAQSKRRPSESAAASSTDAKADSAWVWRLSGLSGAVLGPFVVKKLSDVQFTIKS